MTVTLCNGGKRVERKFSDAYQTPWEATVALLDWLKLPMDIPIWEPACGDGKIVEVLRAMGYKDVSVSDINPSSCPGAWQKDYLQGQGLVTSAGWIVTNPPFSLSAHFIEHAYNVDTPYGFAFLLKSQYWHATTRLQLFRRCPPDAVLPLTWRPDFHFGAKSNAPTMEVYWTVWKRPFQPKNTIYSLLERPTKARMAQLGLHALQEKNHG